MEFNPSIAIDGGLDDEETTPLDTEASTTDHEGDRAKAGKGSDPNEDPDV